MNALEKGFKHTFYVDNWEEAGEIARRGINAGWTFVSSEVLDQKVHRIAVHLIGPRKTDSWKKQAFH